MHVCLHCHKYVFDAQNINRFKRMTALEYLKGVVCPQKRENKSDLAWLVEFKIHIQYLINKADCELCGAPHAVISDPAAPVVVDIRYFFSGLIEPSEKDKQFIEHFKDTYLV